MLNIDIFFRISEFSTTMPATPSNGQKKGNRRENVIAMLDATFGAKASGEGRYDPIHLSSNLKRDSHGCRVAWPHDVLT